MSIFAGACVRQSPETRFALKDTWRVLKEFGDEIHYPLENEFNTFAYTSHKRLTTVSCYAGNDPLHLLGEVRLYNKPELLSRLGKKSTDALSSQAIVLLAYEKWGRACVQYFNGDFAFVVWDSRSKTLFCARDIAGVIPFYYHQNNDGLIFSSAISPINSILGTELTENPAFVLGTLNARPLLMHLRETMVKSVYKLPPGHTLSWSVSNPAPCIEQYWSPEHIMQDISPALSDSVEHLREIIFNAINTRLDYAKHIASHVSGGLDSASVSSVLNEISKTRSFPEVMHHAWQPEPSDEMKKDGEYQRIFSLTSQRSKSISFHTPSGKTFIDRYRRDALNRPFAMFEIVESPIREHYVSQNIDHIFTGAGGDQATSLKSGLLYFELLTSGKFSTLWEQYHQSGLPMLRFIKEMILPFYSHPLQELKSYFKAADYPFANKALLSKTLPLQRNRLAYMTQRGQMHSHFIHFDMTARFEGCHDSASRLGLSYLYPLLDRKVIEFMLALPSAFLRQGGRKRHMLRAAMKPVLPEIIYNNDCKHDPNAYIAYNRAYHEAFSYALRYFSSSENRDRAESGTGKYVDIDRLLLQMKTYTDTHKPHEFMPQTGKISRALSLLDWG